MAISHAETTLKLADAPESQISVLARSGAGIVRYPPEKRMCIKEDVHASKESRMSSGRGAS